MAARRRAARRTYRLFRLDTWDQFLNLVSQPPHSTWAFRGERDERWPLYSSLSRYLRAFGIDPHAWPDQEARILRIFKRNAHQSLTRRPDPDDDFDPLALMAHSARRTRQMNITGAPPL